jgi:hypothetical protein
MKEADIAGVICVGVTYLMLLIGFTITLGLHVDTNFWELLAAVAFVAFTVLALVSHTRAMKTDPGSLLIFKDEIKKMVFDDTIIIRRRIV